MTPELIVFDCDGVLVDSEVLSVEAMVGVMREAGIPATYAMIAQYFGMKQADILAHIAEETGSTIGGTIADKIWPATRALFAKALRPMPGLAEFVARHGDIRRCVASSSSPERIRHSLGVTDLLPLFGEDIFSSAQVARGKPAPDLFLFAADRMGVDPGRCVVVEDSKFGIRGALAAGMMPIGFVGGSHIEAHHAAALQAAGAVAVEASWAGVERRIFG
jgi:HAD superfamily hydrolase (TIGR01509 family)